MNYNEVKKEIKNTIDGPIQLESVYQVSTNYYKLASEKEKDIYFKAVQEIALKKGKLKYREACLTAINMMHKTEESKDVIKNCIERFNYRTELFLASQLMTSCAIISTDWSIEFIKKIIIDFKYVNNLYNLYYFSIRSMSSSSRWIEIIDEINIALSMYDDSKFIEYLNFFKCKRGNNDFERLILNLSNDNLNRFSILF